MYIYCEKIIINFYIFHKLVTTFGITLFLKHQIMLYVYGSDKHTTILQLKIIKNYFFILLKVNCFVVKLYNSEIKERLKRN